VQRAAADVRERQHLEHPARDDLFEDVPRDDRAEGVEHRLPPRVHLLGLVAGQVAELLPADGEQRAEDDDLLLLLALEHGLEAAHRRERRLARPAPAERDDADLGVESRSIAMRCSAERPCRPNTSRSPRTSLKPPSPVTRPRAEPRSEWITSPVFTGSPRTSSLEATSAS
jgi:hypothetical protein